MHSAKYCAPSKANEKGTCFTHAALRKMAKAWNVEHPHSPISMGTNTKKHKLWNVLRKKMVTLTDSNCTDDYCILDTPLVKKIQDPDLHQNTFRPKMPRDWVKNPKSWLSTTDIQKVLEQYLVSKPELEFIGPVPIDFDKTVSFGQCIVNELCNIDLHTLYNQGKRYVGVVFNLDPHDMPGSHWVSLFVNMYNGGIYFFDSVGKFPTGEIATLMSRLRKQGNSLIHSGKIQFDEVHDEHALYYPVKRVKGHRVQVNRESPYYRQSQVPSYLRGMIMRLHTDKGHHGMDVIHQTGKHHVHVENIDSIEDGHHDGIAVVKGFRLFYNDIAHQLKNTECGMYSIHFIDSLLHGTSFKEFTEQIQRDGPMNRKRKIYYRPST